MAMHFRTHFQGPLEGTQRGQLEPWSKLLTGGCCRGSQGLYGILTQGLLGCIQGVLTMAHMIVGLQGCHSEPSAAPPPRRGNFLARASIQDRAAGCSPKGPKGPWILPNMYGTPKGSFIIDYCPFERVFFRFPVSLRERMSCHEYYGWQGHIWDRHLLVLYYRDFTMGPTKALTQDPCPMTYDISSSSFIRLRVLDGVSMGGL